MRVKGQLIQSDVNRMQLSISLGREKSSRRLGEIDWLKSPLARPDITAIHIYLYKTTPLAVVESLSEEKISLQVSMAKEII